jgi:putative membrane protein
MRRAAWLLVVAVVVGACGRGNDAADQPIADSASAAPPAPPAPPAAAPPTDAEIAHIAVTANTIDIEAGEQAKQKSQNAEVKKFAQTMITDHTGVNKQATELVTKLNVSPADNATSQALKTRADSAKTALASLSGAAFDKAYIDNEVAYHQAVLDAVDTVLIPNAQNPELKALLEKVRPAFVAHLEMAKQLKTKLGA